MPRNTTTEKGSKRPMVFISHRNDDRAAAAAVADRLNIISESIDVYLASDPKYQGPRVGKNINEELRDALGSASLVILIFTEADADWSWCMWECGVAMDPNDPTPTRTVTLKLRGDAPKVYGDTLIVDARDSDSVLNLVNQLCTDEGFFLDLDGALTKRSKNETFIIEQADALVEELQKYTEAPDVVEEARWGGFTITLEPDVAEEMRLLKNAPTGKDMVKLLESAMISAPSGWGLSHFGYIGLEPEMTLALIRNRWEEERGEERYKNMPWSEILAEEIWRIVTTRPTRLTWEPFQSLRQDGLWVYPVVYQFRRHSTGRYDFDILLVQTTSPAGASGV